MSIWRPHTTALLVGGVVIVILATAIAFMVTHFQPRTEMRMGSGVFQMRVANDEVSRTKGLSGVESLKPNEGLIIVFETDERWKIWMKDMKIPIDIVWVNKEKKIVYIVKNAAPEFSTNKIFEPKDPARYVIELPAGAIDKNGIKVGQTASFQLEGEGR